MRVAVIGLGSIGNRHAGNLLDLGCSVATYDSACQDQSLRNAIDGAEAVLICTPASTHAVVARELLELGCRSALFCEKPLTTSVADASVFLNWPHPTTQVGYQLRFHKRAIAMHSAIWPANWVECAVSCDMREWPGRDYGSFLLECSHELDLALWCGADPTVLSADIDADSAVLRFRNGQVTIRSRESTYYREWSGNRECFGRFDAPEALGNEMYVDEMRHFLDCAARRVPTRVGFVSGIKTLHVIEQAEALSASCASSKRA